MLRFIAGILAALGVTDLKADLLPRSALWRVEQACMADFHITGAAFPCREVHLEAQPAKGYVVFETPDAVRDIVLMPAVRVRGLEDPFLASPRAGNYFALAWGVRHGVESKAGRLMAHDEIGLAVNSRLVRSQDQFHIHVDCVAPGLRRQIAALVPHLPVEGWSTEPHRLRGEQWYLRRIDSGSLAGTDIMAALHASPPAGEGHFDTLAAGLLGTMLPGGAKGFVLLATDTRRSHASAEVLLDHSCGTRHGASGAQ